MTMPSYTAIGKIQDIFKINQQKIFIVDSITNIQYTYGEIDRLSLNLSDFLGKHGVQKGEKIAIFLPNGIEFVLLYFSCMRMGAIPVPINLKLHPNDITYVLSNSGSKILFADSSSKTSLNTVHGVNIIYLSKIGEGLNLMEKIRENQLEEFRTFPGIQDSDTLLIMYTSGTTNRPKGVIYSYGNMISNALSFIEHTGLDCTFRFYAILSMAYMAGFYNLLLVPFLTGGSVVIDNVFNLSIGFNFWKNIQKHNINALWLVPSIISILNSLDYSADDLDYLKNRNLKVIFSGTAPLLEHTKNMFEKNFSLAVLNSYGLSELLFVSSNSPRLPYSRGVGKILKGCTVLIVNEDGKEVKDNSVGEIAVNSKYAMDGYNYCGQETEVNYNNGFFLTGDIGYVDLEGYLYITDRKKDLIIRGGINISPQEIEEVILSYGSVKEVSVIGVPDSLLGEKIVAFINSTEKISEEEIVKYCRSNLALFKVPSEYNFIDVFPRSATGKIQKKKLREMVQSNQFDDHQPNL